MCLLIQRIQFLITDEETTNQLVSSVQKDHLQKHEKFLLHLQESITIISSFVLNYLSINKFMISVENASHKIINNTLNLNCSFKMDYNEKYIECDKLNLRK